MSLLTNILIAAMVVCFMFILAAWISGHHMTPNSAEAGLILLVSVFAGIVLWLVEIAEEPPL
jgi:drug/metabolite transporter (DMT)-like permease